MKKFLIIVLVMAGPALAAEIDWNGTPPVGYQVPPNDPSIYSRWTQSAYELGEVGQNPHSGYRPLKGKLFPDEQYPIEKGQVTKYEYIQ